MVVVGEYKGNNVDRIENRRIGEIVQNLMGKYEDLRLSFSIYVKVWCGFCLLWVCVYVCYFGILQGRDRFVGCQFSFIYKGKFCFKEIGGE